MLTKNLPSYLIGQFYVLLSDCPEKSNPFGIYSLLVETLTQINWLQTTSLRQEFLQSNFTLIEIDISFKQEDFIEALIAKLIPIDYENLSADNIHNLLKLAEQASQEDLEILFTLNRLKSMFSVSIQS